MKTQKHFFEADVLRGVAIITVMCIHVSLALLSGAKPSNIIASDLSWIILHLSSFGVSLFFVLSGFCIHISFLKETRFSTPQFFWRRFWRIYPAYLAAFVVFYFLQYRAALMSPEAMKQLFAHAFLVHNFKSTFFYGINPSFWSICIEMQLYLLFPLLLLLRSRFGMGGCLLITFVAGLVCRAVVVAVSGIPTVAVTQSLFSSPFSTWFDWTLGAYVADCVFNGKRAFKWHAGLILMLLPVLYLTMFFDVLIMFGFLIESMISAVLLDWAVGHSIPQNAAFKSVAFVGTISYSLYLWHQPLIFRFRWLYQFLPNWLEWLAVFGTLFLLAYFSYQLIERPGIKFGSRLWKKLGLDTQFDLQKRLAKDTQAPRNVVQAQTKE